MKANRPPRILKSHRFTNGFAVIALLGLALSMQVRCLAQEAQWWKGNLHTHSLWSDGDEYPEMIVKWYKDAGYHFLGISDHNVLSQGERWFNVGGRRGGGAVLEAYRKTFGPAWVEERQTDGKHLVRLKPLAEFRPLFEEPNRFLLIQSEEITDKYGSAPVHMNATNLRDYIPPQGGGSVLEVMQNNVNAVLAQREKLGQPMFPHLNHPNFGWAITAEDLMRVEGERFFEVYNGHPSVHNEGDAQRAGTERMWDIILTLRATELQLPSMYGIAVDDAHNYQSTSPKLSNPGRGWVMVRAPFLTPEHIVHAMEAGDFYASTGVQLKDVRRENGRLEIEILPEEGVSYTTQFIVTNQDANRQSEPIVNAEGKEIRATRKYSDEIGRVAAEVTGIKASYELKPGDLYVRAKIISSKPKANPIQPNEMEVAWTQPLLPSKEQTAR